MLWWGCDYSVSLFREHNEYNTSNNTEDVVSMNQYRHNDHQDFEISKYFFSTLSQLKPKGNNNRGDDNMIKNKPTTSKDQSSQSLKVTVICNNSTFERNLSQGSG